MFIVLFFFCFFGVDFSFFSTFFFLWFVYFFSDIVAGWTYFLVTLLAESWTLSLFVRSEFQGISISLILGLRDEYEPDFTLSIFPLFIFLVFSISFPTPQLNPIPKTCPSVPNKSSPANCGHNKFPTNKPLGPQKKQTCISLRGMLVARIESVRVKMWTPARP